MSFDVSEPCWALQKPRTRADIFIDKYHARDNYNGKFNHSMGRNTVMALRREIEEQHNVSIFRTLPAVNIRERARELKKSIFGGDGELKEDDIPDPK
jgi:hypothetical protein